jgi:hypothetical protein
MRDNPSLPEIGGEKKMKITIDPNKTETIDTVPWTRKIRNEEVLFETEKKVLVKIFPEWDSHGDRSLFNDPYTKFGQVKIVSFEVENTIGDTKVESEEWDLYINDEKISGEVHEYSLNGMVLTIHLTIGWG